MKKLQLRNRCESCRFLPMQVCSGCNVGEFCNITRDAPDYCLKENIEVVA